MDETKENEYYKQRLIEVINGIKDVDVIKYFISLIEAYLKLKVGR